MRVINVITIDDGKIKDLKSFGIFEGQSKDEVLKEAETEFIRIAKELGWDQSEHYCYNEEDMINEGYYESEYGTYPSVWLAWSEI